MLAYAECIPFISDEVHIYSIYSPLPSCNPAKAASTVRATKMEFRPHDSTSKRLVQWQQDDRAAEVQLSIYARTSTSFAMFDNVNSPYRLCQCSFGFTISQWTPRILNTI